MSEMQSETSILIVDDDLPFASSLQKILSKAGYEIVLANNGFEGLRHLSSGHFDMVITDRRMGSLSGLDLISSIRRQGIPVKILLLTACGDEESMKSVEKAGADACLSKPVKRDEILECVSLLLTRKPSSRG